jgi:hypothetical protein
MPQEFDLPEGRDVLGTLEVPALCTDATSAERWSKEQRAILAIETFIFTLRAVNNTKFEFIHRAKKLSCSCG